MKRSVYFCSIIDAIVIPVLCLIVMLAGKKFSYISGKNGIFLALPVFVLFLFSVVKSLMYILKKENSLTLRILGMLGLVICGFFYYLLLTLG